MDIVNKLSKKLCKYPGFALSIDEMMKLFKGRSRMTHRMKKKPIKEGFKYFSLCDSDTGFVWHFVPDGRSDDKKLKGDTVECCVNLVQTLPHRKTKHTLDNNKRTLQYVVVMDNYFTMSRTLLRLREEGVGACGTARARTGWPPEEIKGIEKRLRLRKGSRTVIAHGVIIVYSYLLKSAFKPSRQPHHTKL